MHHKKLITHILLLQKGSLYPGAHPLSQCQVVELQGTLLRQCPLHWLLQPLANVPISQPVSTIYHINNMIYSV